MLLGIRYDLDVLLPAYHCSQVIQECFLLINRLFTQSYNCFPDRGTISSIHDDQIESAISRRYHSYSSGQVRAVDRIVFSLRIFSRSEEKNAQVEIFRTKKVVKSFFATVRSFIHHLNIVVSLSSFGSTCFIYKTTVLTYVSKRLESTQATFDIYLGFYLLRQNPKNIRKNGRN